MYNTKAGKDADGLAVLTTYFYYFYNWNQSSYCFLSIWEFLLLFHHSTINQGGFQNAFLGFIVFVSLNSWSLLGNTAMCIYVQVLQYLVSIRWALLCFSICFWKNLSAESACESFGSPFMHSHNAKTTRNFYWVLLSDTQRCYGFLVYKTDQN